MVQAELLSIFEPLRKMMNELTDHLFKIFHENLQKVQIIQKSLVFHSFFPSFNEMQDSLRKKNNFKISNYHVKTYRKYFRF